MFHSPNDCRAQLPNLADKARKILSLLESPVESERFAAANAANRLMRGCGLTMNELLARIATPAGMPRYPVPAARRQPLSQIRELWNVRNSLSAWEHSFVKSLLERFEVFGDRAILSPRQTSSLQTVYSRHFGQRERRA